MDDLPARAAACAARWGLALGEPYPYAYASLAVAATTRDGTRAVLKVQVPHRESEHEAAALARWAGDGAVRLLAHDPDRHALLLERCEPGTPLSDLGRAAAVEVVAGLLPRLWVPAGAPFGTLADEAARWCASLVARRSRYEPSLVDEVLGSLPELAATQGEQALVNQDLHAGNVLRAEREPWLAIDPKPLAGEREFGLAPVLRDRALCPSAAAVRECLDALCGGLGLDRERARRWAFAHAVAWSYEGGRVLPGHLETAAWLRAAA